MIPRIQLVAFEDRGPTPFIFVAIPDERNRYLRTDRSVALAACRHCKSPVGVPCIGGARKYHGSTHAVRRDDAKSLGPRQPDDVIAEWPHEPTREEILEVE